MNNKKYYLTIFMSLNEQKKSVFDKLKINLDQIN